MKRLIVLLWLLPVLAMAADINITNIPTAGGSAAADKVLGLTNTTHTALIPLSQIIDLVTNGLVVQQAVHATNADNVVSSTYVTTSPLTNRVNIVNVDTPGQILTNGNAGAVTLLGGLQLTNSSLLVTGAQYLALSNNTARVLMTNGTIAASSTIAAGARVSGSDFLPTSAAGGYLTLNGLENAAALANSLIAASSTGALIKRNVADGNVALIVQQQHASSTGDVVQIKNNSIAVMAVSQSGNIVISGTLTATNGVVLMVKSSFVTNFVCTTNLQTYLCSGTNQLVTLPNAAYVPNSIYRFTSTNGYGSYIVTNATGAQTIRDGVSLSHKQIGIAPLTLFSDGAQWWLASKDQTVNPNAQFTTSTNVPLTLANTAYPITFDGIANESQGIALGTNGTGAWSVMWITNSGQYEFVPSVVERFSANHIIRYWFRSNGTNVPSSNTPAQGAAGGTTIRVITVSYKIDVTAPTAFEIWVQSDNTGDDLYAEAASGNYPAAPAVICPVKKISDPWP